MPSLQFQHEPDVTVRYGPVPDELPDPSTRRILFQLAPEQCLLDLRRVAGVRFHVRNGNEIVVDRAEGAADNTVRLFLLGSCMAALLVQRGLLPLHGSTVLTPQGAVLFTGPSTSGKSTLAAAFARRGYPVLADDLSTVHFPAGGRPTVTPELKRLKLWAHTLKHLDEEAGELEQIRPGLEKYGYPLGEAFASEPAPLHTLYVLHTHNFSGIEIAPVEGLKKFGVLKNAIYRGEHMSAAGIPGNGFKNLSRLAQAVRVREVRFPHDFSRLGELMDRIERRFWAVRGGLRAMSGLVWLASYPKSGNTWLRIFLNNYEKDADAPADINALEGAGIASSRSLWEQATGIESTDLTLDEADLLRPAVYRWLAAYPNDFPYMKVHDAYTYLPGGEPLFPTDATRAALYILRNPLDVAVSGAPFFGIPVSETPAAMADPDAALCDSSRAYTQQMRQRLLKWSDHVTGWVDAPEPFPRMAVRYEDMKRSPVETFGGVVRFLGLPYDEARLLKAIRFSSFETLRAQEDRHGFREGPKQAERFFRKGVTGSWADELTPDLAAKIVTDHYGVMERFGYLEEPGVPDLLTRLGCSPTPPFPALTPQALI
jgi:hypothetical protein